MDQAMVKRAIGAVVLAIIAALLLGYLLKDKTRERQEVVDMELPGTSQLAIPDLVTPSDPEEQRQSADFSIEPATNNAPTGTPDNNIVASAQAERTAQDPGFAIRPGVNNETREIVDSQSAGTSEGSAAIAISTDPVEQVIASTTTDNKEEKKAASFKPTIVEDKARDKPAAKPAVKSPPSEAAKQASRPATNKQKSAAPAVSDKAPAGKYSIQLLATSSQSRAAKLANTMRSEGYTVFVTQTQSNDKILFRVRVGDHATRGDAVKAQEGMKRRYQKNFFVQNSLVIGN